MYIQYVAKSNLKCKVSSSGVVRIKERMYIINIYHVN